MRRHRAFGGLGRGDEHHLSRAEFATEEARDHLLYALVSARKSNCRNAIYHLTAAARRIGHAELHLTSMTDPPHGVRTQVEHLASEIMKAAYDDIGLRCR